MNIRSAMGSYYYAFVRFFAGFYFYAFAQREART